MYSERLRHTMFHTTIWMYKLKHPSVLDEYSEKFRQLKANGEGFNTNPLSWVGPDDLHLREDWLPIKNLFVDRLRSVVEDIGIACEDVNVQCMWGNIHKSGAEHQLHSHPNSMFSGVMYLNVPDGKDEDPGIFMFRDPRGVAPYQWVFNYIDQRDEPSDMWAFKPEKGMIIIFPSWLEHWVRKSSYADDKDRISLSFNALLKTKVNKHSIKLDI